MADWNDVRRIAERLPEVESGEDGRSFGVRNKAKVKGFAWVWQERLAPKEPRVPNPDVLAVRVAHESEKAILIAAEPATFFTEPHYNGFPAILVRLPAIEVDELTELLTDGWRAQAPKALVAEVDAREDDVR